MSAASRLLPRTLRGRLIAGLVALLAIASASVGLVTYFAVRGALTREVDRQLQTASTLARNCWEGQINHGANGQDTEPDGGKSPAGTPTPAPTASTSAADSRSGVPAGMSITDSCPGLGENTFVAVLAGGHWHSSAVGDSDFTLSSADKRRLAELPPAPPPSPDTPDVPSTTLYLSGPDGTYALTAVRDPDGDGSVYYTGLPLAGMHDFLGDVALAEFAVFGVVLLLAGVLGTLWVRFSLRPDRSASRSTGCWGTWDPRCGAARRARPGCAGSPPTPATSCAPRSRPSGATRNSPCCTPASHRRR
jgi:two-component system, OmpR family, sensor kinase